MVIRALLPAIALGFSVLPALAQPIELKPAATVFVTTTDGGPELKGRLIEFGAETLTLLVRDQRVTMSASRVRTIDLHGDSVKDGAIAGAVIVGGWAAFVYARWVPDAGGMVLTGIAVNAGLGALLGAGADALHKGRTPIFRRNTDVAIVPLKKGAALSMVIRF